MKVSLVVEAIGHDLAQMHRLYRGKIDSAIPGLGALALGRESEFVRWGIWEILADRRKLIYGRTDYSRANSKGSRGVRICYLLESGKRYFVKAPVSWKRTDEYFCYVSEAGEIVRE